jgi:hypothetical protein
MKIPLFNQLYTEIYILQAQIDKGEREVVVKAHGLLVLVS